MEGERIEGGKDVINKKKDCDKKSFPAMTISAQVVLQFCCKLTSKNMNN